jgi:hypothetical protein
MAAPLLPRILEIARDHGRSLKRRSGRPLAACAVAVGRTHDTVSADAFTNSDCICLLKHIPAADCG